QEFFKPAPYVPPEDVDSE
ncbi:hypothetical protein MG5_04306, partial [Candida albicans P57072]